MPLLPWLVSGLPYVPAYLGLLWLVWYVAQRGPAFKPRIRANTLASKHSRKAMK